MSYLGTRNAVALGVSQHMTLGGSNLLETLSPSLLLQFVGAETLDPRITFTRSTTATYFNSAGVLTTTGFNLLTWSEDFTNAAWTKSNATITANTIIAPDGALTGDKLVEDTATSTHVILAGLASPTASTTYTGTVYIKAAERQFAFVGFNGGGLVSFASINLSTGVVSVAVGTPTVAATSVGNGWYRVSVTATTTSTAFLGFDIRISTDGVWANRSYTGDGVSGIFIWGAQLEVGASATTYIPTQAAPSGAPRFDYNPTTLASLGLLIEEQRTNLLLYSTDLSTGWSKGTAATWTLNAATAPDGTMTALRGDGVTGTGIIISGGALYRLANTVLGSTTYTFSVYVRTQTGTATDVRLRVNETGGNNTVSSSLTVTTAWTRLSLTVTTAAGATAISTLVGTGSGTADLFIWGAQLEAGAFATSYIPTVASQVTRAADVAVMTGTNFSDWYNATEGTFFSSIVLDRTPAQASGSVIYTVTDGTNSNRVLTACGSGAGGNLNALVTTGGVLQAQTINGGLSAVGAYKYANTYKLDDFASVANGGTFVTDTSGTVPTVNRMNLGATATGGTNFNSCIRQIAYYPRRLTDAELQAITA